MKRFNFEVICTNTENDDQIVVKKSITGTNVCNAFGALIATFNAFFMETNLVPNTIVLVGITE